MQKNLWKGLFRPENKKLWRGAFPALLVGVLLLTMGKSFFGGETETPVPAEEQRTSDTGERETETRLSEILSKVAGAGAVEVMLTYCKTEERILAQDSTREESDADGKASLRTEYTVVLTEAGSGNTAPFVLAENAPVVEGVVIVAEGGADATVQAALHQAAEALLDVPAHKIAVLQMK